MPESAAITTADQLDAILAIQELRAQGEMPGAF